MSATEKMVRIALVEDNSRYRRQVVDVLNQQADWKVTAVCGSLREAQAILVPTRPHLVLLDIELPAGSGLDLIRPLRAQLEGVRIVMLTVVERTSAIVRAIRSGAAGYILKTDETSLVEHIRDVLADRAPIMSPSVARQLWRFADEEQPLLLQAGSGLTDREWEVLRWVAQGWQQAAIAKKLGISAHTVKTHIAHVYAKLGASSPMEAVARLYGKGGLLGPGQPKDLPDRRQ
jgi:DNA-binding NarL/FixJ family response regulator